MSFPPLIFTLKTHNNNNNNNKQLHVPNLLDDLEVHVSSRNRNFTQRTVSCIHKGTVRVVGITQVNGKNKSRIERRGGGGERDSHGKTIASRTKEKYKVGAGR